MPYRPDVGFRSFIPQRFERPDKGDTGGGSGGRRKKGDSGESAQQPSEKQKANAWKEFYAFRAKYGTNANTFSDSAIRDLNRIKRKFDKLGIPRPAGWLNAPEPPEEPPLVGGGGRGPRRGGPGEGAGRTANIPRDPHKPFPPEDAKVPVPAGRPDDEE